ncbi:unnamed protein product [Linum trigynum]|uniref:Uncharacterized protein n=1 Tax=Linum trigynum TaxID=586398 RepID=A0AAV2EWJ1_9ROSI
MAPVWVEEGESVWVDWPSPRLAHHKFKNHKFFPQVSFSARTTFPSLPLFPSLSLSSSHEHDEEAAISRRPPAKRRRRTCEAATSEAAARVQRSGGWFRRRRRGSRLIGSDEGRGFGGDEGRGFTSTKLVLTAATLQTNRRRRRAGFHADKVAAVGLTAVVEERTTLWTKLFDRICTRSSSRSKQGEG